MWSSMSYSLNPQFKTRAEHLVPGLNQLVCNSNCVVVRCFDCAGWFGLVLEAWSSVESGAQLAFFCQYAMNRFQRTARARQYPELTLKYFFLDVQSSDPLYNFD